MFIEIRFNISVIKFFNNILGCNYCLFVWHMCVTYMRVLLKLINYFSNNIKLFGDHMYTFSF